MASSFQEEVLAAWDAIYLTRLMDAKQEKLVRQNKGGSFHISVLGHEMVGVMAALSMVPGKDWALPYYRDRGFPVAYGCSPVELFGSFLARTTAHHSGGRMMPEHFSDKQLRIPCQSSCVGSQFLQAVGVAQSVQFAGKDEVVYVSGGDGSTSQGDFHEALNYAALHRLGVLFVIQDNDWAISVPGHQQTAGTIASVGRGYEGLAVFDIDGCDYSQLKEAFSDAVTRGRKGEGPSLIIAKVPRIGAHSISDDPKKYKKSEHVEEDKKRDPLPRFEEWMLSRNLVTQEELAERKNRLFAEVEEAARQAEQIPFPDPSTAADKVFAALPEELKREKEAASSGEEIVMIDAIHRALTEEMEKNKKIVVFGEDVAHGKGGVFLATRGLTEKFGEDRCFNTPLAESTIVGMAMGMSMAHGMIPVAEVQFADYIWTGVNQLFNELATVYYRSNGEWNCPVVLRMPCGGYIQGGPYHSQSIEGFLAHVPGLKVAYPSNASDAYLLLKAAIADPNPVVFLEHKALYRQRLFCARSEPSSDAFTPLGKAKVVQEGNHVTLIAWGMTVVMGVEAARVLAKEGISVEVVDLRTIVPLDMETVLRSIRKTGKVVVAHEAPRTCGFGAEVTARIMEEGFSSLDAPVRRVTGKDCPVPYAKMLEEAVLPQVSDLEAALRELALF